MLNDTDLADLAAARHPDPFAVLGLHAQPDGSLWVRAMRPGAEAVDVLDAGSGQRVATLQPRGDSGLWEGQAGRRRRRFDYRLHVRWPGGVTTTGADAYAWGPLLSDTDLHFLAEGTHLRPWQVLGAHLLTLGSGAQAVTGVRFAVWAPAARRVSVVGPFNTWDGRRHPMRHRGGSGVWELFVPDIGPGEAYQFEIVDAQGERLPLKADPYARQAALRPARHSVVAGPAPHRPRPRERAAAQAPQAPVSIYEVHLGSWRRRPDGGFHDWDTLAAELPAHAASLGFTHLELLPITEHPFDGSWGYQTLGQFAPTARFGPPEGLARFLDACHAHGLGVLLDWVPAHFPADDFGLARFDGSALYEYADPREGFHRDWNTLIPNFARHEVRNFLAGSALYWTEAWGLDGLRVDAVASMLYRDYSRPPGQWVPNVQGGRENLEAIALLRRVNEVLQAQVPGAMTVAEESTSFPRVTGPVRDGGLGFAYKWNMGWMHDTLHYMAQDPVHRRWHHDRMTFGLVYAWAERFVLPLSHDEVVHGKRSLLGKMPGDRWQQFANLRAYYGFMWGHPGKKLLFMGQEFAQPTEWADGGELPWGLLQQPEHAGVMQLVGDLNHLYRSQPALHRLDADPAGFEWLVVDDAEQSVFAWVRRDGAGSEIIVVCNMTPVPRPGYRLPVPAGARGWREVLNTDATVYGGSGQGALGATLPVQPAPARRHAQSIALTLPPLATVFLAPTLDA